MIFEQGLMELIRCVLVFVAVLPETSHGELMQALRDGVNIVIGPHRLRCPWTSDALLLAAVA